MFIIQDHNYEMLLFEISQPGLKMIIDVSAWTEHQGSWVLHEICGKVQAALYI